MIQQFSGHQVFDIVMIAVVGVAFIAKVVVATMAYRLRVSIWQQSVESRLVKHEPQSEAQ